MPAGVSVLFRQPTVFEEYGSYIVGTICLIAVESALIGGLVIQRRRRRRAEESLPLERAAFPHDGGYGAGNGMANGSRQTM